MKALTLAVLAVAISTGAACAQHPLIEMFTPAPDLAKQDDAYCQSIRARGVGLHPVPDVPDQAAAGSRYGVARWGWGGFLARR